MNPQWNYTNENEQPTLEKIDGKIWLRVPQISIVVDGKRFVHPAFIKSGGEVVSEILKEL